MSKRETLVPEVPSMSPNNASSLDALLQADGRSAWCDQNSTTTPQAFVFREPGTGTRVAA
jgi:hypothetical protein